MSTLQFQFLILIIAGWVNRTQQDVIEYLEAENRVLREQLGDGRLLLTDGQRRRLAVRAKAIGRLLAHYAVLSRKRVRERGTLSRVALVDLGGNVFSECILSNVR